MPDLDSQIFYAVILIIVLAAFALMPRVMNLLERRKLSRKERQRQEQQRREMEVWERHEAERKRASPHRNHDRPA